jgi:hypothetical protein
VRVPKHTAARGTPPVVQAAGGEHGHERALSSVYVAHHSATQLHLRLLAFMEAHQHVGAAASALPQHGGDGAPRRGGRAHSLQRHVAACGNVNQRLAVKPQLVRHQLGQRRVRDAADEPVG